jgi:hypothetical protein
MPRVFTYGPEAVQGLMYDRVGPSEFLGPARLEGFALVFDKPAVRDRREGLANVREGEGEAVLGSLFEVSAKQLELLHGFHGGYEQRRVNVLLLEGDEPAPRDAIAWVARRTRAGLAPARATLDATRRGLEDNGAAPELLEALATVEALG